MFMGRGGGLFAVLFFFFCLPKRRNKKKAPVSLVPPKAGCPEFMPRMGYSSMLPGLCKLAALKQCKSLFSSLSGARLRANGILSA
jgi:hypothetical protein